MTRQQNCELQKAGSKKEKRMFMSGDEEGESSCTKSVYNPREALYREI